MGPRVNWRNWLTLDFADIVVLNKFDRAGAEDALIEIRKQFQRNREAFDESPESMPVIPTIASQFADAGVDRLWEAISEILNHECGCNFTASEPRLGVDGLPTREPPIPPERQGYLAEVASAVRGYHSRTERVSDSVRLVQRLEASAERLRKSGKITSVGDLEEEASEIRETVPTEAWGSLERFEAMAEAYRSGEASYTVRGREIPVKTTHETMSGTKVPRVALPTSEDWGERLKWIRKENVPGSFPYTGGVFPFRREDELPVRMFAGEGSAERTNKRYHFLSKDQDFNRLSVAFDSPSLYGNDPQERLDIFGKVCESGVSISTIDEMDKLFEGFDLCAPNTSVSMTINGNYWWHLASFLQSSNKARDEEVRRFGGQGAYRR